MDQQELRDIFDHYDRDGNGVIDRDEFAALCRALDPSVPDREVDTGLGVVDHDGNGTIEFAEFAHWWTQR
jgi:Ca2+-binding EF-hand superfamily protein